MPRVTVVVCTYNRSGLLKEAIESVLNQSYHDMKIVVLDNCSTDNTKDVVMSFNDDRLEYMCNEKNLGMVGNWNRAMDICDTEYLNIFHDDDRMLPWMIEELVKIMEKYPDVGLAASSCCYLMDESSEEPTLPNPLPHTIYEQYEYVRYSCKKGGCIAQAGSIMVRMKIVNKMDMRYRLDVGIYVDMYFAFEANSRGLMLCIVDCPLFKYRKHDGEASMSSKWEESVHSFNKIDDFITGLGLCIDMRDMREYFTRTIIINRVKHKDYDNLKKTRHFLENEFGWNIRDKIFADTIAVTALAPFIIKLSRRDIGFREYMSEEDNLLNKGISVPVSRKVKWFLKYILWKRWLRM